MEKTREILLLSASVLRPIVMVISQVFSTTELITVLVIGTKCLSKLTHIKTSKNEKVYDLFIVGFFGNVPIYLRDGANG